MSFLLILPRSVSPMNRPIVSSSRRINTKGSHILHALILARGKFPSMSLITCLSAPSTHHKSNNANTSGQHKRTRLEDSYRVCHHVQNRSTLEERAGTNRRSWYTGRNSQFGLARPRRNLSHSHPQISLPHHLEAGQKTRTRDTPGEGLASVLRTIVSLSAENNPPLVFSYDVPFTR